MKLNIVIAALIGSSMAVKLDDQTNQDKLYEFIQTGDILEHRDYFNGWVASMEEFPGTVNQNGNFKQPYVRQIPPVFDGDSAAGDVNDKYTQNLIINHAIEGVDKGKKGKINKTAGDAMRTHKFYMDKATARKLAVEILGTHFGKSEAEANAWLDSGKFQEAWNYWDVLDAGRVDAVGSSTFFRYLTRSLGDLDLQ